MKISTQNLAFMVKLYRCGFSALTGIQIPKLDRLVQTASYKCIISEQKRSDKVLMRIKVSLDRSWEKVKVVNVVVRAWDCERILHSQLHYFWDAWRVNEVALESLHILVMHLNKSVQTCCNNVLNVLWLTSSLLRPSFCKSLYLFLMYVRGTLLLEFPKLLEYRN